MPSELGLSVHVVWAPDRGAGFDLDVELRVPPGITVVLGPSGAGKSSMLAAIAGLVRPSRGRIALGDAVLFDSSQRVDVPIHRRRVGFVFQSLALFPHLSAEDNVAYGLPQKLRGDERRAAARGWLTRVHAGHVAARRPPTLSGGEAQRVAMARALASDPTLLLLDEPFSAMDDALRVELRAELKGLVSEVGLPTLFVTHDKEDADALADRVARLAHGRLVAA